jgi:hypothetical protein
LELGEGPFDDGDLVSKFGDPGLYAVVGETKKLIVRKR